mmetsp:Transcript_9365/g.22467  ORF Transcript_9365/g.22467 Transcript_9365/m.22467 type:complete len:835 (-) Transcript_9365:60-2564(-)
MCKHDEGCSEILPPYPRNASKRRPLPRALEKEKPKPHAASMPDVSLPCTPRSPHSPVLTPPCPRRPAWQEKEENLATLPRSPASPSRLSPQSLGPLPAERWFHANLASSVTSPSASEGKGDCQLPVLKLPTSPEDHKDSRQVCRRQSKQVRKRLQKALALQKLCDEEGIQNDIIAKATPRKASRRHSFHSMIDGRPISKKELERWDAAFTAFSVDGEIHLDDLKKALLACGFCDVRENVFQDAVKDLTCYNTLDRSEFDLFVCRYETALHETYELEFSQLDTRAGTIDAAELDRLLCRIGQPVRRFVLDELVHEVAPDGGGRVDFKCFLEIRYLIKKREGFAKEELDCYSQVFRHFDRDNSGTMRNVEFASVLAWLGFPSSSAGWNDDIAGPLNKNEFFRRLQLVHKREMGQLKKSLDARFNKRLRSGEELTSLIHSLGYSASPQAVLDALLQTGLCPDSGLETATATQGLLRSLPLDLGLDEVCRLLSGLRSCDGFTAGELRDLREAFSSHSHSKDQMSAPAVCQALRWLGRRLPLDEVLQLIGEVDADGSDMLDFTLFVKVSRKCKEKEQKRAAKVFHHFDTDHAGFLDETEQFHAFRTLGCLDEHGQPPYRSAGEKEATDLPTFLTIIERFRAASLAAVREHQGYSFSEMAELARVFKTFDRDGNGLMSRSELARLVEQLFPRLAPTMEFRPVLMDLFTKVDQDANGSLDFGEFVAIMRRITDHEDEVQFELQTEAIEDLGFSHAEANQFRQLFMSADEDGSRRLSLEQIREMLSKSFRLSEARLIELRTFFDHVVRPYQSLDGGDRRAGFIEFLHIMRKVAQAGWCADDR